MEKKEIIDLLEKGANSTEDIQGLLKAGTTCGRCLTEIDYMVKKHNKEKPKDKQRKLRFGF